MSNFKYGLLYGLVPAACTFIPMAILLLVSIISKFIPAIDPKEMSSGMFMASMFVAPIVAILAYVVTVILFGVVGVSKVYFVRVSVITSIGAWILYVLLLIKFMSFMGKGWGY